MCHFLERKERTFFLFSELEKSHHGQPPEWSGGVPQVQGLRLHQSGQAASFASWEETLESVVHLWPLRIQFQDEKSVPHTPQVRKNTFLWSFLLSLDLFVRLCSCSIVPKAANNFSRRKRHGIGAKVLECELCDYTSTWEGGISSHMNKKHGGVGAKISEDASDSKTGRYCFVMFDKIMTTFFLNKKTCLVEENLT